MNKSPEQKLNYILGWLYVYGDPTEYKEEWRSQLITRLKTILEIKDTNQEDNE